ncbi:MAG: hypothetical protein WAM70_07015, partial [Pyrinomonadaceae bacterium]
ALPGTTVMARLATYGRNVSFSSGGSSSSPIRPVDLDDKLIMELSQLLTIEELKELAERLGRVSSKRNRSVLLRKALDEQLKKNAKSSTNERRPQSYSHSANLLGKAVDAEYRYATLGLVLGLATIIGGIILGLNGVAGSTSWTARLIGLESKINDAAPGVVLFIVGIFLVFITRPKVSLDNLRD